MTEQVRQIQNLLTELNFDVGIADGALGPKTEKAIQAALEELRRARAKGVQQFVVDVRPA